MIKAKQHQIQWSIFNHFKVFKKSEIPHTRIFFWQTIEFYNQEEIEMKLAGKQEAYV